MSIALWHEQYLQQTPRLRGWWMAAASSGETSSFY